MAAPTSSSVESRIAELERLVQDLRVRLATIERLLANPGDHPADQTTVRKKVTYDWQA